MKKRLTEEWIRSSEFEKLEVLHRELEVYDTRDPGLVLRVRKSGKRFFYLYRDRGRSKTRIGEWPLYSVADARRLIEAKRKKAAPPKRSTITLAEYFDREYRAAYELHNKSGKALANLSKLMQKFGEVRLKNISAEDVDSWRRVRRREGIQPSTINRQVAALSALLNTAIPKYLSTNSLASLKTLRQETEHRVRYLGEAEEKQLRAALAERDKARVKARRRGNEHRAARGYELKDDLSNYAYSDHLTPMVLLSINTGLRQAETFSLEWRDIKDGFVTVRSSIAKSGRTRRVPLNAESTAVLSRWGEQSGSRGFVFQSSAGGKFDNVRRAWTSMIKAAEIEDFRWHDMRHHFASQLVMRGASLMVVKELLGHADLKTTMRYAHLAPGHLKEAVELLS